MKTFIAYGRNVVTIVIALLSFFSCTSGLKTSITEPLPASELEKLDINQTKLYDRLQNNLSHKSESELAALLDVTYADFFNFVQQVNDNHGLWRKEAYDKWLDEYQNSFKAIDDYYQKWIEWERANSLDTKIDFKLHRIKMPSREYGSQYIDFDLVSHVGKLKKAYIDFGFDTPENTERIKTDEFSVAVLLGNSILHDAPIGDKFSFTDHPIHDLAPKYLIGKSSEEILDKYRLLTKISSVILEDGTEIYSTTHLRQIPKVIVNLWKKEQQLSVNYKNIENFYDNEAVEIASLANVKYQPLTQYIEAKILEKMNAINMSLVPIYEELNYGIITGN